MKIVQSLCLFLFFSSTLFCQIYDIVEVDGKFGLTKDYELMLKPEFDEVSSQYYGFKLFFGEKKDYILTDNYVVIDSFPRIEFITRTVEQKRIIYDSDLNEHIEVYYDEVPIDDKYVFVYEKQNGLDNKSIYSLEEMKIISPWFKVSSKINLEKTTLYLSYEEEGLNSVEFVKYKDSLLSGFYLKDLYPGTEMEFEVLKNDKRFFKLKKSEVGSKYLLYKIEGKILKLISDEYDFLSETNYITFKGENGKFGFVGGDKVSDAEYDSLFMNRAGLSCLTSFKNGMYGLIDVGNGSEIKPCSKVEIRSSDSTYNNFLIVNQKNERFFVDFWSQTKFKCSRNSVYPKKEGNYFYLFGKTNTETGKFNQEIKQAQSPFLSLEIASTYYSYYKALGTNKKTGIINFKGDTIFPFIYDEIDLMNYDGDVFHYVSVMDKKQKYLYRWWDKKIINIPFSNIKPFSSAHEHSLLFEVGKPGELGLFNVNDSSYIFDMKYDNLTSKYSIKNYGDFLIAEKISKFEAYFCGNQYSDTNYKSRNSNLYDFLFKDFGYIKVNDKFQEYDLFTHQKARLLDENEIFWEVKGITIFYQGGKFGVKNQENRIIFPVLYDDLHFITHYQSDIIYGKIKGKSVELNTETNQERYY